MNTIATTVRFMLLLFLAGSAMAENPRVSPMTATSYANTLTKQLWNIYYLVFDQQRLAEVLPHPAYSFENLKPYHCQNPGKKIGLVRPVDTPQSEKDKQSIKFEGMKVEFSSSSTDKGTIEDVCKWTQKIGNKFYYFSQYFSENIKYEASQIHPENSVCYLKDSESFPDNIQLLMTGKFVENETSHVRTVDSQQSALEMWQLAWPGQEVASSSQEGPGCDIWKITSEGGATYYVSYPSPSQKEKSDVVVTLPNGVELGEVSIGAKEFSFWYTPTSPKDSFGDLYLLTDKSLLGLNTAYRIEHGALD